MLGQQLGSYRVIRSLGKGGMGEVYEGEHNLIGKRVAIKVLLPEYSRNAAIVQRFFNEARAATLIRHPGIIEVFDFGHHTEGSAFIVMEFLEGEALSSRLARAGRVPEPVCLRWMLQLAGALGAAHAAGITHRDLKPDNIFICPDPDVPGGERPKVLDFGIAKLSGDFRVTDMQTRTGAIMGTPRYMAPEQIRGTKVVDHRADLYALGCIAFQMLCGRLPFLEEGLGDLLAAHMFTPPPRLRDIEPSVSPWVEEVVLRLLAKEPAERFSSTSELAAALEHGPSGMEAVAMSHPLSSSAPHGNAIDTAPTTLGGAASALTGASSAPAPRARAWKRRMLVAGLVGVTAAGVTAFAVRADSDDASLVSDSVAAHEPDEPPGAAVTGAGIEEESNRWIPVPVPGDGLDIVLGVSAETARRTPDASGLRPEREVRAPVAPYEIQQHEVTWGELEPWLVENADAQIHRPAWVPADASKRKTWPATGIPWETAYRYCRSMDARLPSEAEWEYAARGAERRPYAWGAERLDRVRTHAYAGDDARLVPVGTRDQDRTPGAAHLAIHDMMGNAQEWVADLWREDRLGEDESWVQANGSTFRTVRGLPVNRPLPSELPLEGAAHRDALCASKGCIEGYEDLLAYVGIRCARDARP